MGTMEELETLPGGRDDPVGDAVQAERGAGGQPLSCCGPLDDKRWSSQLDSSYLFPTKLFLRIFFLFLTELSNAQKRKRYGKRSEVWSIFAHLDEKGETSPTKCRICGKYFSFKSTTSDLYGHPDRCHKSEVMPPSKRPMASDYNPQLPRLLSQSNISVVGVHNDSLHALAKKSLRIPLSDTTARVHLREMIFRESSRRVPSNLCLDG